MTYYSLKHGFAVFIVSVHICVVPSKNLEGSITTAQPDSPVEVTAVFINCEIDDAQRDLDNEDTRFEREELFKHNALRNCDKKLALTIKLTSESANSADEYVAIDHVSGGRSQGRVRLLNPYVLRIRRDPPLEAYKLRFIDTVSGILAMSEEHNQKYFGESKRAQRDAEVLNHLKNTVSKTKSVVEQAYPVQDKSGDAENIRKRTRTSKLAKRHEKNVIIEENLGDVSIQENGDNTEIYENKNAEIHQEKEGAIPNHNKKYRRRMHQPTSNFGEVDTINASEQEFALYQVEDPTLWFSVHINLFEKLSTPKGNTLWNDITKGESVSIGSMSPDWNGSDMNAHYKSIDLIAREDFLFPNTSLRLLKPLVEENMHRISNNMNYNLDKNENYILVPSEDVLDIDETGKMRRTLTNVSAGDTNKHLRRVVVRVAKTLWNAIEDKHNIVTQKSEKYLTIPHRGSRFAQVDVEVRADDNQLVQVSPPGRIAIIVADNSRGTRSTVTVQATNTGLVAARFRAQIRDCDSGTRNLAEKQGIVSEPVLLPPRHTRRLLLRLPSAPAADLQHCSVYLLNENDESVAVRGTVIKKGDQCYCVWHCDCVCYGDNSKLACQEMSVAQQDAAGLPPRGSARYTRACRYNDVTAIDVAVVMVGVIAMLLCLGVLKGLLGLVCPRAGVWGLDRIIEAPRQLDRYYECALRCRPVVYDDQCWPVHPDTCGRTVRVVSLPVEFILNVVFFVVTPGLIIVDAWKQISKCRCCFSPDQASRANQPKSPKIGGQRHDVQMFPLLLNERHHRPKLVAAHTSGSDSEQEDAAFVLMQMQKSSESLARHQMKSNVAGASADTGQVEHLQAD